MTVELAPPTEERLAGAVELVRRWYSRARKSLPFLSSGDDAYPDVWELVVHRLADTGCVAATASEGGALGGFLAAKPLDLAVNQRAALYAHPRSAMVMFGGLGLAAGRENDVLRDLYLRVAERLVAQQRLVHYVQLPADDTVAMAWFRLGFGLEQIRGLMPIKARGRQPRGVEGLTIRRASDGDLGQIGRMAVEAARYHQRAAMFLPQSDAGLLALRTHYAETLQDPHSAAWLAVRRGEEIGMVVLAPALPSPVLPARSVDLIEAYVAPQARGEGISRVLLATALAWAYDHGYRYVTAGWRTASGLAAGHWPSVGFKPVGYRLSRVLQRPGG